MLGPLGHKSETAMRVPTMTDLNTVCYIGRAVATFLMEKKILSYNIYIVGEAIFEAFWPGN